MGAPNTTRGDTPWPRGELATVNAPGGHGSKVANACLIAAAPDLYKALDRLLNWPARFGGGERAEDVAFARAVLAKASGKSA